MTVLKPDRDCAVVDFVPMATVISARWSIAYIIDHYSHDHFYERFDLFNRPCSSSTLQPATTSCFNPGPLPLYVRCAPEDRQKQAPTVTTLDIYARCVLSSTDPMGKLLDLERFALMNDAKIMDNDKNDNIAMIVHDIPTSLREHDDITTNVCERKDSQVHEYGRYMSWRRE